MNVYEMDFRIEPLYAVIVGIDAGLAAIRQRLDRSQVDEEEWFDALWAREYAEPLLGLGFVAAQTYAVGTWSDVNRIRISRGKPPLKKSECYKCYPITLKGNVTRIELINATANYFKHHDEWLEDDWSRLPKRNTETIETLNRVGITQQSEFPCIEATELICGVAWEFVVVHSSLKEWRKHVLDAFR